MASFEKPVVFDVGSQKYGVDINCVSAIEQYANVVPVPNSVAYIKGIINLRGEVVPVFDLHKKFGIPMNGASTTAMKMIVVKVGDLLIALEVDSVSEIHDIPAENLMPLPRIVQNAEISYFTHVGNANGTLILMIDVENLLTAEEKSNLQDMKEELEK